jgi:mannose-6-phosphate isomerase-like protein (cupin superfamily)
MYSTYLCKKSKMNKELIEHYNMHMDVKFGGLELIDVNALAEASKEKWFNQTLTKVNGSVVRLGVIEGEFHWHKHDNDDEFFYVVEGLLLMDLEGRTIELKPGQGITVPKGVLHRTRAPQRTVILMVETASIDPTGD